MGRPYTPIYLVTTVSTRSPSSWTRETKGCLSLLPQPTSKLNNISMTDATYNNEKEKKCRTYWEVDIERKHESPLVILERCLSIHPALKWDARSLGHQFLVDDAEWEEYERSKSDRYYVALPHHLGDHPFN